MNAMLGSRPDICIVVSIISRYQSSATVDLWNALKRVLCYIKESSGQKVHKCISFQSFSCSVSWVSKKQPTVSLLLTEFEIVALSKATSEACWLNNLYHSLSGSQRTIVLYEDNVPVISLCKDPQFYHKLKHIGVKILF
ncbi:uncharacterized protein LOC126184174 [Schistocerca cancellata]|uniref:uncharacterized protein LOC126184174 n=1 Tax=Schistocerca cancellata TaxID=274614 RepID=UPI002118CF47|nr:uncharacterized protein LOC126184174 [Schistocerca cancellata]